MYFEAPDQMWHQNLTVRYIIFTKTYDNLITIYCFMFARQIVLIALKHLVPYQTKFKCLITETSIFGLSDFLF